MTERGRDQVTRTADQLRIGPSGVRWDRDALTIDIAEVGAPIPWPVRGQVRIYPDMLGQDGFALDPAGRHRWHPIAPRARIEVDMDRPGLRWKGSAYLDSNFGDEPLADGFRDWNWSRAHLSRDVAVLYEGRRRDDTPFGLALKFDREGRWHEVEAPPRSALPRTLFLMPRTTHADRGHDARVLHTWEDAPFYARSAVATRLFGEDVHAVHESLALNRFRSPFVRGALPYRMPRRSPWSILLGPVGPLLPT
jgi:carotenoid 1,2-hydratase